MHYNDDDKENDDNDSHESSDATSSSSDNNGMEPNWELLKATLGQDTLVALQQHLTGGCEDDDPNDGMITPNSHQNDVESQPQTNNAVGRTTIKSTIESPPHSNTDYDKKDYWDDRFTKEDVRNWLVTYDDVRDQLAPFLRPESKILIVGCGNSTFSEELYDAGFRNMWNLDFSQVVIDAMTEKYAESRPEMKWVVMDMTDMHDLEDESFDVVLDKAAMDALLVGEGDVWNPDPTVVELARSMCRHISRILVRDGGHHVHISFAQPHFRKKYLLGWHPANTTNDNGHRESDVELKQDEDYSHEFGWTFRVETIQKEHGCFHHFLYIMTKQTR